MHIMMQTRVDALSLASSNSRESASTYLIACGTTALDPVAFNLVAPVLHTKAIRKSVIKLMPEFGNLTLAHMSTACALSNSRCLTSARIDGCNASNHQQIRAGNYPTSIQAGSQNVSTLSITYARK